MRINGVIQRKFALLDRSIIELSNRLAGISLQTFSNDLTLRWMTERALQVMAEIVIDVTERILALKGAGPAASAAESVEKLVQLGVLQSAAPYIPIVRFRNLVMHQYEDVDPAIVFDIAMNRLDVLRQFRDEVDRYDLQG